MLYTPHFLVGAAILKYVPNPVIGLPMALVSHILLDMTPHSDFDIEPGVTVKEFLNPKYKNRNFIIGSLLIDYILTTVSFVWILFRFQNYLLLAGGVVGILPDAMEQALMLVGIALPGWQTLFQNRVSMRYGFISYPIVSIIAIWFLIQ
jgi:hypothetical protein